MVKTNPVKKILSVALAICLLLTTVPLAAAKSVKGNPGKMLLATASDVHYYPESLAKYKSEAFYTYLQGSNINYEDMDSILDSAFAAFNPKTYGLSSQTGAPRSQTYPASAVAYVGGRFSK